ncbi:MAG: DUF3847 domain-containing protein [Lachnospiraceae bacterium]|nr:DUF3847 domain-containing protein [Lachnospiraceae bacterium]
MANRKTIDEKITAAKLEKEQAEARIKKLLQEQKADERKARNHRFCKRGGFMEKLLPDLALLTDEQFETFFKNTTANNYGRRALAELIPLTSETAAEPEGVTDTTQSGGNAVPKHTDAVARTETTHAPKNTGTAQNHSNNNHHKPAQAGTQQNGNAGGKSAETTRVAG